jgi:hypothetical protein
VVEYSRRIPVINKVNKIGNKAILRELLKKYGKEIIYKNKIKQPYLSSISSFLNDNYERLITLFNNSNLKDLYDITDSNKRQTLIDLGNGKITQSNPIGNLYHIIAFGLLTEKLTKKY